MLFLPFSHRFLCLFYWPPFFFSEKEKSLQSTKAVCQWNSPTMKASSWLRAIFLFSTEMDQLKSHPICCLPFAQFVLKPRRKPDIFENWQNIDKNLASSRIAIHHIIKKMRASSTFKKLQVIYFLAMALTSESFIAERAQVLKMRYAWICLVDLICLESCSLSDGMTLLRQVVLNNVMTLV